MFALSFKNGNDDPKKDSFEKYCIPLVEIKDFNASIDNKVFFHQPIKKNKKHMKNLSKYQKMVTTQQEIYWIFRIIKVAINLLV